MAVPIRVPNLVFTNTGAIKDPWHKAIGKLVLIAFYFLLRVGKYTYHNIQRRTQQFRLGDMKFFAKEDNKLSCSPRHANGRLPKRRPSDSQANGSASDGT